MTGATLGSASTVVERGSLRTEVAKFKRWASAYPVPVDKRSGEWEVEYDDWPALHDAALMFLASAVTETWTEDEVEDLLYAIARDNEIEHLSRSLRERPDVLLKLAALARGAESAAKWQLASQLGTLSERKAEAERLLLTFVEDDAEYVSRRALLALGALHSPHAERLAERAWRAGHLYQRMAALHVLAAVSSRKLPEYVRLAYEDGRPHLIEIASSYRVT